MDVDRISSKLLIREQLINTNDESHQSRALRRTRPWWRRPSSELYVPSRSNYLKISKCTPPGHRAHKRYKTMRHSRYPKLYFRLLVSKSCLTITQYCFVLGRSGLTPALEFVVAQGRLHFQVTGKAVKRKLSFFNSLQSTVRAVRKCAKL